jgi:hypothetical protein
LDYRCQTCFRCYDQELAAENGFCCIKQGCGGPLLPVAVAANGSAGTLRTSTLAGLDRLPSLLAIPLHEFSGEEAPVLRLHRLCDCIEILTRFCTVVALAEVRAWLGDEPLPRDLLTALQPNVERPTFGKWLAMLLALTRQLHQQTAMVLPELPEFVLKHLMALVPEGERLHEQNALELRNLLAHGGAMTRERARYYLTGSLGPQSQAFAGWESRLRDLLAGLSFLGDAEVFYHGADGTRRLVGTDAPGRPVTLSADLALALKPLVGHVVLLRQGRWLDLWPLCDFDQARTSALGGPIRASQRSPLVYIRAERERLLYAALGVELSHGEKSDPVEDFQRLFHLGKWKDGEDRASWAFDFEEELRRDADAMGGSRAEEVRRAKDAIKQTQQGVLWISGPGGIGKSFLLATLAEDLRGDPKRVCRIAWRFKIGDGVRCNRVAFFRHAIERLASWERIDRAGVAPAQDSDELLGQLRDLLGAAAQLQPDRPRDRPPRVLFFLDGLDEIGRLDPGFVEVPWLLGQPNVVWVCAGRDEGRLPEAFAPGRCTPIFPDGLPFMSDTDIRGMLIDRTGALKYDLLRLDLEGSDEPRESVPGVVNRAVGAVVQRARGLPLYVHFVIEDVLAGHFRFAELESRLPPTLNAYYDDLLRRLSIGELQAMLTPLVVTLAWAQAPLNVEMLRLLMVHRKVVRDTEHGRSLLERGLAAVQSLVRMAPLPGGSGYEAYHFTFREHIRADQAGLIGEQNSLARDAFCELTRGWASLPSANPLRSYLARHGLAHCQEGAGREDACLLAVQVAATGEWQVIALLVEALHELRRTSSELVAEVLARLKAESSYGARLVRLVYHTWRLPTLVARTISEVGQEVNWVLRAHRIVELFEQAIKFTGLLALADYLHLKTTLPAIEEQLIDLERPTLGRWAGFQRAYYQHCVRARIAPVFPSLAGILSGEDAKALQGLVHELIDYRNRLAHGGVLSRQQAEDDLVWVMGKVARYLELLAALAEGQLVVLQGREGGHGRFWVFSGPNPQDHATVELPAPPEAAPGEVFFTMGGAEMVRLTPYVLTKPDCTTGIPFLVYLRGERDNWVYVDAQSNKLLKLPVPENDLFPRSRLASLTRKDPATDYEEEFRADAAACVGRQAEVAQVKAALKEAQSGVFWVSGTAGIGKSYLLAKVAEGLRGLRQVCLLAWRFRADDGARCNRVAFFRYAVQRLSAWPVLSKANVTPAQDADELQGQLHCLLDAAAHLPPSSPREHSPPRVLFLLDGLDVIEPLDRAFLQVPFLLSWPNVLWVCAGRPQGCLPRVFSPECCTSVFPDGLPPMSDGDVRAMLLDTTGGLKPDLVPAEPKRAPDESLAVAIQAMVKRAQGLPLYVRLAIDDIQAGRFRLDEMEQRLPPSLNTYYVDLLRVSAVGDLPALLTPLVLLLAWATEPLDLEVLLSVLAQRQVLLANEAGRALLRRGLEAAQAIVRVVSTADGGVLYELFHHSLRTHLQNHAGDIQNTLAREALAAVARDTRNTP